MVNENIEDYNDPLEAAEDTKNSEYPKHTKLADFFLDENGNLNCTLNIDFKEFDIDIKTYLHGDDTHTELEYELIYFEVAKLCNQSGEYSIDCFKDRYTVRKTSEIEKIHYEAMTNEEKVSYIAIKNRQEEENELLNCEKELQALDYIGVKIATGRGTIEEYAEEIAKMKQLAKRVKELRAKLYCL